MDDESPAYVARMKQTAFRHGMPLVMLSIHQDFVDPDPAKRQQDVDHTIRCLELAARLGIPCIRLNSGRWNTIASFDDLMKVKGQEPPSPGHTDKDAFDWVVAAIQACLPAAERLGVVMALENHWGLTTSVDTLLAIHKAVGSPWLGINLDTGNYPGDPYAGIAALAPHASIVQAKTYYGGGEAVHARSRLRADRGHPAGRRVCRLGLARDGRQGITGHRGAEEPRAPAARVRRTWRRLSTP